MAGAGVESVQHANYHAGHDLVNGAKPASPATQRKGRVYRQEVVITRVAATSTSHLPAPQPATPPLLTDA